MISWLLGFFYFTLLVGMTPMEVAAALMLLAGFWELIRRRWTFYGAQAWGFFLLWFIAVLLSFLYNQKTKLYTRPKKNKQKDERQST